MAQEARVELSIGGSSSEERLVFCEPDVVVVGRNADCNLPFPKDTTISRYHMMFDINPPMVSVRDLGSLKGTWINGEKYGGRPDGMSAAEARGLDFEPVALKHDDVIEVGRTRLHVGIVQQVFCDGCQVPIPDRFHVSCLQESGQYVCGFCLVDPQLQAKLAETSRLTVREDLGQPYEGTIYLSLQRPRAGGVDSTPPARPAPPVRPSPPTPQPPNAPGVSRDLLGPDFQILQQLGEGAMGQVFLATDAHGVRVAIKVMKPHISVKEESRRRFLREIQETFVLDHENIVGFGGCGVHEGMLFMVMELCPNGSVSDRLNNAPNRRLGLGDALRFLQQTLRGLSYAHSQGRVHRDIKPANLMLDAYDRIKIADLGLAKSYLDAGLSGLTATNSSQGTPSFMPREQLLNFKRVKPASDVWSVAATFYKVLSGHSPRVLKKGQNPMLMVLNNLVVPLRRRMPDCPEDILEVFDVALSDDLGMRYEDAGSFLRALEATATARRYLS